MRAGLPRSGPERDEYSSFDMRRGDGIVDGDTASGRGPTLVSAGVDASDKSSIGTAPLLRSRRTGERGRLNKSAAGSIPGSPLLQTTAARPLRVARARFLSLSRWAHSARVGARPKQTHKAEPRPRWRARVAAVQQSARDTKRTVKPTAQCRTLSVSTAVTARRKGAKLMSQAGPFPGSDVKSATLRLVFNWLALQEVSVCFDCYKCVGVWSCLLALCGLAQARRDRRAVVRSLPWSALARACRLRDACSQLTMTHATVAPPLTDGRDPRRLSQLAAHSQADAAVQLSRVRRAAHP